ncbi:MAG: LysR substrate-binding domain-containing protein [Pseudomonadota bacterium]
MFNNIRHLRYVVQVALSGSLLQASRELLISESAVSAAIKAVESELGYSVFIRQPSRPLSLTTMGAEFIAEAQAFLDQAEAFHQRSRGMGSELSGTVRLGCAQAFASVVLPTVLIASARRYPLIRVEFSEHDLPELLQHLRDGTIDLGITYNLQHDSEVAMRALVPVAPHVGVAAHHPLARAGRVRLCDLAANDMILIDHQVTRQHILSFFARHDLTPRVLCQPRTIETMHALISAGLGYGIFFLKPAAAEHSAAGLRRLAIDDTLPCHDLVLARPRATAPVARIEAVAELCAAEIASLGSTIASEPCTAPAPGRAGRAAAP